MLAIGPSADPLCHKVDNASFQKRITPFSIENILANSNSNEGQLNGKKNLFFPYISPQYQLNPFSSWNQDVHLKLLANRLCIMNAYQPFWFSNLQTESKLLSACCRLFNAHRPHPYLDLRSCKKLLKLAPSAASRSKEDARNRKRSGSPKLAKTNLSRKVIKNFETFENGSDLRLRIGSNCSESDEGSLEDRPKSKDVAEKDSPLSALERLTCATFKGMETKQHELHAVASGREATKTKRRKCRTAFTAFQLSLLEQRFNCHKYLTPADRDQISHILGLSSAQVITWFQNRRAKQKRDLEEMKNDFKTVERSLHQHNHDPKLA